MINQPDIPLIGHYAKGGKQISAVAAFQTQQWVIAAIAIVTTKLAAARETKSINGRFG